MFRYPRDARLRRLASLVAVAALATSLAACGSDDSGSSGAADDGGGDEYEVKLGYFPNLTHASAIVGKEKGFVADALAEEGASVKYLDFNSGSDTIDSLLGGSLDATYIGPSPAITAFAQSQGGVSIISRTGVLSKPGPRERRPLSGATTNSGWPSPCQSTHRMRWTVGS